MDNITATTNFIWSDSPFVPRKISLPFKNVDKLLLNPNQASAFTNKTNFDAKTSEQDDFLKKDCNSLMNVLRWNAVNDIGREFRLFGMAENRRCNSYKTALCKAFKETGTCVFGNMCRYAHGGDELRLPPQAHPKYKTQLCNKFALYGRCPYGPKCQFIHHRPSSLIFRRPVMPPTFEMSAARNAVHYVTDDVVKQPSPPIKNLDGSDLCSALDDLSTVYVDSNSGSIEFASSFPGPSLGRALSFRRDTKSTVKQDEEVKISTPPDNDSISQQVKKDDIPKDFKGNGPSLIPDDWYSGTFDQWLVK
uniref:C3H1-type domain-containing protein n=1 Tax=Syphacia muris TaxID=451379 RepID=A0A0N5ACB6_9BILA